MDHVCSKCGKVAVDDYYEEYYSMGIYAGRYCSDHCWSKSGYRDVDASAFDESYAGERLEPEEPDDY